MERNDSVDSMASLGSHSTNNSLDSADPGDPRQISRRRRLLRKAPDAPKRFKSAYICYVMDKMDDVKKTLADDTKVTDAMKILAGMWRNLSEDEKMEYEQIAEADKSRYFAEMENYTGPMQVPNKRQKKPPGAPKRAMSAFLSFSQMMRPLIRTMYPSLKNTDISGVLAQRWKAATEEEKLPHLQKELRDREKYHEEMTKWKEEMANMKDDEGKIVDPDYGLELFNLIWGNEDDKDVDFRDKEGLDHRGSIPPLSVPYSDSLTAFDNLQNAASSSHIIAQQHRKQTESTQSMQHQYQQQLHQQQQAQSQRIQRGGNGKYETYQTGGLNVFDQSVNYYSQAPTPTPTQPQAPSPLQQRYSHGNFGQARNLSSSGVDNDILISNSDINDPSSHRLSAYAGMNQAYHHDVQLSDASNSNYSMPSIEMKSSRLENPPSSSPSTYSQGHHISQISAEVENALFPWDRKAEELSIGPSSSLTKYQAAPLQQYTMNKLAHQQQEIRHQMHQQQEIRHQMHSQQHPQQEIRQQMSLQQHQIQEQRHGQSQEQELFQQTKEIHSYPQSHQFDTTRSSQYLEQDRSYYQKQSLQEHSHFQPRSMQSTNNSNRESMSSGSQTSSSYQAFKTNLPQNQNQSQRSGNDVYHMVNPSMAWAQPPVNCDTQSQYPHQLYQAPNMMKAGTSTGMNTSQSSFPNSGNDTQNKHVFTFQEPPIDQTYDDREDSDEGTVPASFFSHDTFYHEHTVQHELHLKSKLVRIQQKMQKPKRRQSTGGSKYDTSSSNRQGNTNSQENDPDLVPEKSSAQSSSFPVQQYEVALQNQQTKAREVRVDGFPQRFTDSSQVIDSNMKHFPTSSSTNSNSTQTRFEPVQHIYSGNLLPVSRIHSMLPPRDRNMSSSGSGGVMFPFPSNQPSAQSMANSQQRIRDELLYQQLQQQQNIRGYSFQAFSSTDKPTEYQPVTSDDYLKNALESLNSVDFAKMYGSFQDPRVITTGLIRMDKLETIGENESALNTNEIKRDVSLSTQAEAQHSNRNSTSSSFEQLSRHDDSIESQEGHRE